jgi:FKBP-type peptidyl-prolyl cis-trans isomerase
VLACQHTWYRVDGYCSADAQNISNCSSDAAKHNQNKMSRGKVTVEIFTAGDGINYPKPGQTVTIHYIGYLVDGSQWDSSRDRGKPFKFKLAAEQVVQGLDEGVSQLSIGERAKLIIPPNLGYGAKGFPGLIPPNSTLIFDVELITFN